MLRCSDHSNAASDAAFDSWAAEQLDQQISSDRIVGLAEQFKMVNIKPLVLQWCISSWLELQQRKDVIANGWYSCCLSLDDVNSRDKRVAALSAVAQRLLDDNFVPDGEEDALESDLESDGEVEDNETLSDGSGIEQDPAIPVPENARRSGRNRKQAASSGYMLNSQNIAMTEDSEA